MCTNVRLSFHAQCSQVKPRPPSFPPSSDFRFRRSPPLSSSSPFTSDWALGLGRCSCFSSSASPFPSKMSFFLFFLILILILPQRFGRKRRRRRAAVVLIRDEDKDEDHNEDVAEDDESLLFCSAQKNLFRNCLFVFSPSPHVYHNLLVFFLTNLKFLYDAQLFTSDENDSYERTDWLFYSCSLTHLQKSSY